MTIPAPKIPSSVTIFAEIDATRDDTFLRGLRGLLSGQRRAALQVAVRLLPGSGMTTPMLATHSNCRFSCKGFFRVSGRIFSAVLGSHDGNVDRDDVFIATVFCFLPGI